MKKKLLLTLTAMVCVLCCALGLAACGDNDNPDNSGSGHNYASAWVFDETYHWHECTALHECDGSQKIAHQDANNDNICDGCNNVLPSVGLEYEYDGIQSGYMLTGIGDCTDTDIVIPMYTNADEYAGYCRVTGLEYNIFYENTTITSVVIPDSVVYMGDNAFFHCTALERVTIGNGLTEISHDAFAECNLLESIVIPNNVKTIKYNAFASCEQLESVTIGSGVETIEEYAFDNCISIASLSFVNSTTPLSLGDGVFGGMSVTSLSVPDRIVYAGRGVFADLNVTYTEYENAKYIGNASNPYLVLVEAIDKTATSYTVHANTKVLSGFAFRGSNVDISINLPAGIKGVGAWLCSGRYNVDIHYAGTEAQWREVNKMDFGQGVYYWTVTCTDGGFHKN